MAVSSRTLFILRGGGALAAVLGMFLIAMGAAFGGGPIARQWVGLGLLAASLIVLASVCAKRGSQLGWPGWAVFIGVFFTLAMGPAFFVLMLALVFARDKREEAGVNAVDGQAQAASPARPSLQEMLRTGRRPGTVPQRTAPPPQPLPGWPVALAQGLALALWPWVVWGTFRVSHFWR
jgi:hypothetical protein